MTQEIHLRGEYWIQDGHVEFADGNVSDNNHESIAIDSVFRSYENNVVSLAEEYGIEIDRNYGDYHSEDMTNAIYEIEEHLQSQGMSEQQIRQHIIKELGCNNEAFEILCGGGNARLYAMKYENWIAIRQDNIELYGYDETKRRYLADGIPEILHDEGIDDDVDAKDIEFTMHDLKTNRSNHLTLQDIENPVVGMRTNQNLLSTKSPNHGMNALSDENKGMFNAKSVKNQWTTAAQQAKVIPPGHDLWRNTSEGMSFAKWLNIQESITSGKI